MTISILFLGLIAGIGIWPGAVRAHAAFEMDVVDVGQGLCVLLEADGHYALYDGGGRETASYVVAGLKGLGLTGLELVVASHYDEDHLSGLVGTIRSFDCGLVLRPGYEADTAIAGSFARALEDTGTDSAVPQPGDLYFLGGAVIEVVGPLDPAAELENDRSIALHITYGDTAFWLGGDAQESEEEQIAASGYELRSDVYVADHHGAGTSSCRVLLERLQPGIAVISCGEANDYGHPGNATLERLEEIGCQIYRTDVSGTVAVHSDGDVVWVETEEALMDGEMWGEVTYVCNVSSGVFHLPTCPSAEKIWPGNRLESSDTREDVLARGYRPCGICRP